MLDCLSATDTGFGIQQPKWSHSWWIKWASQCDLLLCWRQCTLGCCAFMVWKLAKPFKPPLVIQCVQWYHSSWAGQLLQAADPGAWRQPANREHPGIPLQCTFVGHTHIEHEQLVWNHWWCFVVVFKCLGDRPCCQSVLGFSAWLFWESV